ncbi:hypothetical protein [Rhodococcus opacus]|uniref:hypothetical protein n=1 Tax=Rhodococcus opacus TaxID=37919 RepID=UPI002476AC9F|nr:hypothetical protein [Rhodococcus opacus]MDH6293175.1 hypothetical protein [Rhodococcus opacus]
MEIYQVKKFAENLKPGQIRQIRESYEKVKGYAAKRGWTITAWHLVMPLDGTPENDEWYTELTSGDDFEATWKGSPVFDNWAADYPQVVDYYLEGGKARLAEEMRRFAVTTSILLPGVDADAAQQAYSVLEPATAIDRVALLNTTLNDADPHYQYAIFVGADEGPPPRPTEGFPLHVASATKQVEGQTVTVHIFARCAESLNERPISHKGTVVVEKDSEEERQWRQFLDYGRVPSKPLKVRNFVSELPGGLGGALDEGLLLIHDTLDNPEDGYDRVLAVVNPDGVALSEITVRFAKPRSNHDGTGMYTHGTDASGLFTVELLSKTVGKSWDMTYNFAVADPTDQFAVDIAPALAFAHYCYAPNMLRISDPRVRRRTHVLPIPTDRPRNKEFRFAEQRFHYIKALAAIQEYADFEVRVPNLEAVDPENAAEIIRVGRLLDGETVTVGWDTLTVILHNHATELEGLQSLVADSSLEVCLGESTVRLGVMRSVFEAAEVTRRESNSKGEGTMIFRPALGKNTAQLMWIGPESI